MPTQRRAYSGSRAMQDAILKLADEDSDQPRLRMVKEGKPKSPKRSSRSSPNGRRPSGQSPKRSPPSSSSGRRRRRPSGRRRRRPSGRRPSGRGAQAVVAQAVAVLSQGAAARRAGDGGDAVDALRDGAPAVALRSLVLAPLPKKAKGGFIDKAPTSQLHFLEVLFDVVNDERARVIFLPAGAPPTGQGRFAKARLLLACDPLTPGGACCVFDTMQRRCVRFDTPAASAFWQRCTEHIGAALDLEDKGEEEGGDGDDDDDDVEHILLGVPSDDHDGEDGDGVGWALGHEATAAQSVFRTRPTRTRCCAMRQAVRRRGRAGARAARRRAARALPAPPSRELRARACRRARVAASTAFRRPARRAA